MMADQLYLKEFRKLGYKFRRTPSGDLEVRSATPLSKPQKEEIKKWKEELLRELEEELSEAVTRGQEAARELLSKGGSQPTTIVTEELDGLTVVTCSRRDGTGWTISVPKEEWDPFKMATALMSASPAKRL